MNGNGHALEIEWVDPKTLKPHERNYRGHPEEQLKHIVQSIKADGIYKNLVTANDDTLLAGHGVREAAIQAGIDLVPIKRMPYGPDDPRALKLLAKDNEISRAAVDDLGGLAQMLREIAEFDIDGLLGTGVDDEMLRHLEEEAGVIPADWDGAFSGLPDGDKAPFQQMTFTLHDSQAERVKEAIARARREVGAAQVNENSNGNALAYICGVYLDG
jgi:hypothetical protein